MILPKKIRTPELAIASFIENPNIDIIIGIIIPPPPIPPTFERTVSNVKIIRPINSIS